MKDYVNQSVLANLFKGPEAVGGKIFFYDQGLIFKSHALNIQKGETAIAYANIASISKRSTFMIVPNGISIITKDQKEYKFVLYHRNDVIEFLNSKMEKN